jgi:hypothetical protein
LDAVVFGNQVSFFHISSRTLPSLEPTCGKLGVYGLFHNGIQRDMGRLNLSGSEYGPLAGACEHVNEPLRFHGK